MDNRAHTRRQTLKHGSVTLRPGTPRVDCVVRDLSPAGARIWTPHWVSLPSRFKLNIPGELQVEVRVRWTADQETGVQFLSASLARTSARAFGKSSRAAA